MHDTASLHSETPPQKRSGMAHVLTRSQFWGSWDKQNASVIYSRASEKRISE